MRPSIAIYITKREKGEAPPLELCARDFAEKRAREFIPSEIVRPPYGKPHFLDESAPRFSVSHTGELWGVALSFEEVGFDMEREREANFLSIAKRFFHAEEVAYIEKNGRAAFFDVWTAKEAYVKLLGTGIDGDFHKFSVVDGARLAGEMEGVHFARVPYEAGYHVTVATGARTDAAQYELILC